MQQPALQNVLRIDIIKVRQHKTVSWLETIFLLEHAESKKHFSIKIVYFVKEKWLEKCKEFKSVESHVLTIKCSLKPQLIVWFLQLSLLPLNLKEIKIWHLLW